MAGAPLGNQNRAKGAQWRAALDRALERREKSRADGVKAIDEIAEELLKLCMSGDLQAIKEFADRMDGKAAQSVTVAGDESAPLVHKVQREIIRAVHKDSDG